MEQGTVKDLRVHVWGRNKPTMRQFNREGKVIEYRSAVYSGHRMADSVEEAIRIAQDYMQRGWDVEMKFFDAASVEDLDAV